jgi:hypothetical protein
VTSALLESKSVGAATDPYANTNFIAQIKPEHKAFRVPAYVRFATSRNTIRKVTIPPEYCQCDQGSDLNLIQSDLHKKLGLKLHPLSAEGFKGITMKTADGNSIID